MIGMDDLAGIRIRIGGLLSRDHTLQLAVRGPDRDTRTVHRLKRVPGHDNVRRGIRAELQVKTRDGRFHGPLGTPARFRCVLGCAAIQDRHTLRLRRPINGERFRAYVEQALVSTLKPEISWS